VENFIHNFIHSPSFGLWIFLFYFLERKTKISGTQRKDFWTREEPHEPRSVAADTGLLPPAADIRGCGEDSPEMDSQKQIPQKMLLRTFTATSDGGV
jgi:hypothetical protein